MELVRSSKKNTEGKEAEEHVNVNQLHAVATPEEAAQPPQINLEVSGEDLEIIENFRFPAYNEIPDVGLFLEQTGHGYCQQPTVALPLYTS